MSGKRDDGAAFAIGYGRPPAANRFKPGQSGNPKGRPKGARNFATEIAAELDATVILTENGKRKKVAKRQIVAKQLVNKGAQGDAKAISLLLQHERMTEAAAQAPSVLPVELSAADLPVMKSIIQRIRRMEAEPDDADGIPAPEPIGEQP